MDGDVLQENPVWPNSFHVDILVYVEDWTIEDQHLIFDDEDGFPPRVVIIESISRLPDDLLFIRGVRVPSEESDPERRQTYYGIISRWQYDARRQASESNGRFTTAH